MTLTHSIHCVGKDADSFKSADITHDISIKGVTKP